MGEIPGDSEDVPTKRRPLSRWVVDDLVGEGAAVGIGNCISALDSSTAPAGVALSDTSGRILIEPVISDPGRGAVGPMVG